MPDSKPARRLAISEACLDLLASVGSRGLTHRAIDQQLGLPPGSTSYYFRTTRSLWAAASDALVAMDEKDVERRLNSGIIDMEGLLADWLAPAARTRLLARFELYLAGARDEEFREHLNRHRGRFLALVEQAAAKAGAEDPAAAARTVVAQFEGTLLQRAVFF